MNVGSLFSGIGGLDLGLARAGWDHVFLCESDEYRRRVLAERFPGVPIAEDVREVAQRSGRDGHLAGSPSGADIERLGVSLGRPDIALDLICGGFPCQDVSVAGRRAGLDGARSGLFFEFARVADALRPDWLLIENVPGLLSSNNGRDFATIVAHLDGLGYVGAWRILDSRYFGVPQRRRRVFILAARAELDPRGERCAEILAVGSRCHGHPAESREAGEDVAYTVTSRPGERLSAEDNYVTGSLGGGNTGTGRRSEDDPNLVYGVRRAQTSSNGWGVREGEVGTLDSTGGDSIANTAGVRRLTPRECERLQALPDDWTLVDWNGKTVTDSRRYAAAGDAVTATVAEWIGRRLLAEGAA